MACKGLNLNIRANFDSIRLQVYFRQKFLKCQAQKSKIFSFSFLDQNPDLLKP